MVTEKIQRTNSSFLRVKLGGWRTWIGERLDQPFIFLLLCAFNLGRDGNCAVWGKIGNREEDT